MSLSRPYCSVAEVQQELRNTDPVLVPQLEAAINQASRWIDSYTCRDFYLHDHSTTPLTITPYDHCVFGRELFPPLRPIISITEVKVLGVVWVSGTDWAQAGDRLIALIGRWVSYDEPGNWIEIKGKFGYDQTTDASIPTGLPADVQRAAILTAAAFTGHNMKEVLGNDGTKEVVIDKAIPKTAHEILKLHKRRILI